LVRRAKIVLLYAAGLTRDAVAEQVGVTPQTAGKWRERFRLQGLMGLYDERRPGKPRTISDEKVADLIHKTLETKPQDGTHWSCRSISDQSGISKSTVQRVWSALGIQPHRQKNFKLSTDPFFVEKVHDIVGLYLNPPDHAMVLCVDEKSHPKPSNEANRCYPWVWAMSKVSRTTTKGMVRQRSSRHWMFRQAKCSASVADGIDTRSSFGF
jgi:putative transposase